MITIVVEWKKFRLSCGHFWEKTFPHIYTSTHSIDSVNSLKKKFLFFYLTFYLLSETSLTKTTDRES